MRVLLYVVAGLTFVMLIGVIPLSDSGEEVGQRAGLPFLLGLAGGVLALFIKPRRQGVRIGIIVVQALWLFVAVGRLVQGDPTGLVTMVLPIVVLVLVNAKPSRAFFRRPPR